MMQAVLAVEKTVCVPLRQLPRTEFLRKGPSAIPGEK